jgi:hypothetical protein
MKILLLALIYGGILVLAHWRAPERVPEADAAH